MMSSGPISRNNHTPATLLKALSYAGPAAIWEPSVKRVSNDGLTRYVHGRVGKLVIAPKKILRIEGSAIIDPISALRDFTAQLPHKNGALGVINYDSGRRFERINAASYNPSLPEMHFIDCANVVHFDYETNTVQVISEDQSLISEIERALTTVPTTEGPKPLEIGKVESRYTREQFIEIVEKALEYIRSGDVYQIVIGNTFHSKQIPDPLELYTALKNGNPSPYHFLYRGEDFAYVGASPEVFMRSKIVAGATKIAMRLIAGTYPRSKDPKKDQELAAALLADPKERAEHIMLVDHERNDIGKVAKIGAVEVNDLFSIETYSDVHHLVTEVAGTLRSDCDVFSALEAAFPIATLTGTPKIRAMEIIAELEGAHRGPFGGAIVSIEGDGAIDSAVLIRTACIQKSGISIQAGAGIVFDSDPSREYDECSWKAQALLTALGAI